MILCNMRTIHLYRQGRSTIVGTPAPIKLVSREKLEKHRSNWENPTPKAGKDLITLCLRLRSSKKPRTFFRSLMKFEILHFWKFVCPQSPPPTMIHFATLLWSCVSKTRRRDTHFAGSGLWYIVLSLGNKIAPRFLSFPAHQLRTQYFAPTMREMKSFYSSEFIIKTKW